MLEGLVREGGKHVLDSENSLVRGRGVPIVGEGVVEGNVSSPVGEVAVKGKGELEASM